MAGTIEEALEDAFDIEIEITPGPIVAEVEIQLPDYSTRKREAVAGIQSLIALFDERERLKIMSRFCACCGADLQVVSCRRT